MNQSVLNKIQVIREDIPKAVILMESIEFLMGNLQKFYELGMIEEVTSIAANIKTYSEELARLNNKGRLYEIAKEMQIRGIKISVVTGMVKERDN
ncbi:hypothetical protein FBF75_17710 [Bacillus sp. S2(2019)]|uniref:YqaH family protein n=1 Tax=Bacillus TaxID=1386 RepID=UPI0010AE966C|nr:MULTISPECIES: YqaH family protein [Bacillus]MCY7692185.1 hypothetical protein [Bacillus altitudinis]TKD55656.1 hypothetical protein FBF75_17710 [Bacillus sp. S2(2019)]